MKKKNKERVYSAAQFGNFSKTPSLVLSLSLVPAVYPFSKTSICTATVLTNILHSKTSASFLFRRSGERMRKNEAAKASGVLYRHTSVYKSRFDRGFQGEKDRRMHAKNSRIWESGGKKCRSKRFSDPFRNILILIASILYELLQSVRRYFRSQFSISLFLIPKLQAIYEPDSLIPKRMLITDK